MKIGVLARATGVSCDALRLYERLGLISAQRRDNGYRDFDASAVALVRLIRQAQGLGFTLAEIREVLATGALATEEVAALLRDRLAEIDLRLGEMQALRAALQARLEAACPLGLSG